MRAGGNIAPGKLNFPSTIMIFHTHWTLYVPVDANYRKKKYQKSRQAQIVSVVKLDHSHCISKLSE